MLLNETFTAAELPQGNNNFAPLPAGWYTATVTAAEIKQTKTGTGEYIKVRYAISGPTHQGRVGFGNLNIKNANPKAEEIGRQQLGELMRAIGLSSVKDTDQLIGGNLSIKLDVRLSEQYGDSNEVKAYKSVGGSAAPAASAPAKAAPPWAAKK